MTNSTTYTASQLKINDVYRHSAMVDVRVTQIEKKQYKNGNYYLEVRGLNMDMQRNKKRRQGVIGEVLVSNFKLDSKINIK